MNAPREPNDRDDELLATYRRASAQEGSGPGPRVRASILAQVRREHAPAAANDGRWRARAAAGVAVLGLVGWLALHGLRNAPRHTDLTVNTDSMATAPVARSTPVATPSAAATPGPVLPERRFGSAHAKSAAPAAAAAEVRTEALVANSAGPARASAAPGEETLVRRAVTARFAGLFLPRDSDHLNQVFVLMDRSGDIVRSAVETASPSAAQGEQPGPPGDFQSLGLRAEDIAAPGFVVLVERAATAGAPDRVLLVRYAWTREPGQ